MRLLFVGSHGKNRSRTAAELLSDKHPTRYAGVYHVTEDDIEWAEVILVMEEFQKRHIASKFPAKEMIIVSLDIPDYYVYNSPDLIFSFKKRFEELTLLSS